MQKAESRNNSNNNVTQFPSQQLSVPRVENTRHVLFDTSPKNIERELVDLPYADINCALTLAKNKLKLLNRFALPAIKREGVSGPFHYAFQKFVDHFRSFHALSRYNRPPTDEDLREMALFTQEMAYSYKHIFLGFLTTSKKPKDIACSLYNAMFYIGQSMLQSYEQNQWQNPRLWQEIHFLYACAEEKGFLGQDIPSAAPQPRPASIDALYKQLSLTALADPYKLAHGWHWAIFDYAGKIAHHAEIQTADVLPAFQYGFAIRLDTSKPPIAVKTLPAQPHSSLRILLPQGAATVITNQLHMLKSGQPQKIPGLSGAANREEQTRFLQLLHHQWAEKPLRNKKRESIKESMGFIWGVNDIHKILDPEERHRASKMQRPVDVQHRSMGLSHNESADGICITLKSPVQDAPRNGQVVALIRKINNQKQLVLGIVQWSAKRGTQQLTCGIKKLQSPPQAALIAEQDTPADSRPALLFRYRGKFGEPNALILTNSGFLRSGKSILVNAVETKKWQATKPTSPVNQTDCIDLFELQDAV